MLGKTLTGRYKIVNQLGGGGFSHTFIAEDGYLPDRPLCVIKQLKPASSQAEVLRISRELFDKEAKILYRLGKHDCIPSLLAHFEEDEEFFLAQELIEGNVLSQEIKSGQCWGEEYTIDFLTDILSTLDFVHRQQVIHRDIKPSNLIRRDRDRKIVLIDFGAVKEVSTQSINQSFSQLGNTSSLVIGSPGYMPNEQYSGKTIFASDIYAIGIIAIQALTGLLPNQIPENPLTSEFCWRDHVEVTPTLADVIDKMVRFDFRQRYQSINELLGAIQPLRVRSLAQIILSEITPPLLEELPITPDTPQSLIEEISDDLEMSADPIRAKKLVCLVCTGILENDLHRLDNFSFVELLEDIYQQYPTIESLKENLVKSVKTIAVHKQQQYLTVAKIVFNAASKFYQQHPQSIGSEISETIEPSVPDSSSVIPQISYNVSHLVINAGSAQLVAPLDTSHIDTSPNQSNFTEEERSLIDDSFTDDLYLNEESDIYALAFHDIDIDAQQIRLKKLLLYAYQDVWENDLSQLNSVDWLSLLRELNSFMPTFPQLIALIQEAVQRVSKPAEYVVIGNLLLTKLECLYPDSFNLDSFSAIASVISQSNNQSYQSDRLVPDQTYRKIPFDPKIADDLFDLRLDLMRFTNSMRAKILLFSALYYPFEPDRDNWHDLKTHRLDGLLRQLFYAYPSFIKVEKSIWETTRSLSEPTAYAQSANYILQAIKVLYDQLDARSMEHPADGNNQDDDCTQPSAIAFRQDDDDSCQFA